MSSLSRQTQTEYSFTSPVKYKRDLSEVVVCSLPLFSHFSPSSGSLLGGVVTTMCFFFNHGEVSALPLLSLSLRAKRLLLSAIILCFKSLWVYVSEMCKTQNEKALSPQRGLELQLALKVPPATFSPVSSRTNSKSLFFQINMATFQSVTHTHTLVSPSSPTPCSPLSSLLFPLSAVMDFRSVCEFFVLFWRKQRTH